MIEATRDERAPEAARAGARPAGDRRWWLAVAGLVLGALILRVWGLRWGLPFAYNLDERSHFVPRAVGYFDNGSLDPDYQLNPSGLIEWVAAALLLTHFSPSAIVDAWREDPGQVWTIARAASALLSTASIALIYIAGKRLFDRWVGLVAAAILATAFLPVHYGHLALNDAPSLTPTLLSLIGIAGIVRGGRLRDYAIAGAGLGIAVGFKYNAAFMLLPLLTAAAIHAASTKAWRAAVIGLVVAGATALVGFAICDPYALLRPDFFRSEVEHLSDYTSGGLLLGETQRSGYRYYAWSLPWAFGVLPLLLAAVGAVRIVLRERVQALLLLPAVVIFLLVIGSQGRYFARYAMPIYPFLALIAGAGAVWLAREAARRVPALRRHARVAIPLAIVLVCAQGLVTSIHNDLVLAREDTRSSTREWLAANLPSGTKVAVEPLVPAEWYEGTQWERFRRSGADAERLAQQHPGARKRADFANYGYTLFPGYLDYLREQGVCWIVSGSTQSGRSFNNPRRVPEAIRYYRALEDQADLRYEAEPYDGSEHYFQYDLAFNYAPLRYERPGAAMRVYQLKNCG